MQSTFTVEMYSRSKPTPKDLIYRLAEENIYENLAGGDKYAMYDLAAWNELSDSGIEILQPELDRVLEFIFWQLQCYMQDMKPEAIQRKTEIISKLKSKDHHVIRYFVDVVIAPLKELIRYQDYEVVNPTAVLHAKLAKDGLITYVVRYPELKTDVVDSILNLANNAQTIKDNPEIEQQLTFLEQVLIELVTIGVEA
jgi:hypothetical protein